MRRMNDHVYVIDVIYMLITCMMKTLMKYNLLCQA